MQHREFVAQLDDSKIARAIATAEEKSSGEIRVFVSRQKPETDAEALALAQRIFTRLGMTKTKHRNGVLLFFAPATQKFAIIGDSGVHEKCGPAFWEEVAVALTPMLKQREFTSAVISGVERAGKALADHFPRAPDDSNELPNVVERD
jgi:uncharacterized membrane protein